VPAYGPQNDVTLKMPAFEWVHVQLHQQKGMISLSPPTICNSAQKDPAGSRLHFHLCHTAVLRHRKIQNEDKMRRSTFWNSGRSRSSKAYAAG
ncbi:hypothetical protein ACET9X_19930, partial [Aeromonas veronii]